jgi:hypothetical protein
MELHLSHRDRSAAQKVETGLMIVLLVIAFGTTAVFMERFVSVIAG